MTEKVKLDLINIKKLNKHNKHVEYLMAKREFFKKDGYLSCDECESYDKSCCIIEDGYTCIRICNDCLSKREKCPGPFCYCRIKQSEYCCDYCFDQGY